MHIRRLGAVIGAAAVILAGCSQTPGASSGTSAAPGGSAAAGDCTVGMSWNNYQEERWAKWDEPAIKAAIEAGGGTYTSNDAKSSAETQATNVENLITQGADVVIILAEDDVAIKPSVTSAIGEGVPVIAYDRLIEDPGVLYITFDNIEVGRMQARVIFEQVPEGKYAMVKNIAEQEDIPAHFLAKILQQLARKGLLRSSKGPTGGFALRVEPAEIRLLDIVEALDGLAPYQQCASGLSECSDDMPCSMHDSWINLRSRIMDYLGRNTIADLAKALEQKKKALAMTKQRKGRRPVTAKRA